MSFNEIFTMDDVSAAFFVTNYNLLLKGKSIINSSHGIGCYSPYVCYSKFYTFNKKQSDFYNFYNSNIEFIEKYSEKKSGKINLLAFDRIILVDQGDFVKRGFIYENQLQKLFYTKFNKIAHEKKIDIRLKLHPLASVSYKDKIKHDYPNLEICDIIPKNKLLLSISLYSTSYYDFKIYGMTAFFIDNIFIPDNLFGPSIDTIHISQLNNC